MYSLLVAVLLEVLETLAALAEEGVLVGLKTQLPLATLLSFCQQVLIR
jgi:hypothetical protein